MLDMKGGDVIMIQALRALEAAGALKAMNVTVVMTGDEESSGDPQSVAREALVAAAKGAHVAIGFEDGDGRPAARRHRPAGHRELDAERHRHAGALLADFPGRHRLRRGVRGGSHPERVSREAGRAGAPHVQPGAHPRRDADDVRGPAVARICVRQGERHPGAGDRHRRHSRALEGAVRRRAEGHDVNRGGIARRTRRRRSRSTKAIHPWRQPTAIAGCSRSTIKRAATSAPAPSPPSIPTARAPPTCRSSRARCR